MAFEPDHALEYIYSFDDPYLAALRDHGKQTWGLEGIRQLLEKIGSPHLATPTIHIAGTKGKGSTAALITQVLIESGLKTGLYCSPHLEHWQERIQVNREPIPGQALAALVDDIRPHAEQMPISAFEVTTALAFWHFAREGCDAAVIEVGLGGRLDATSVVEPIAAVITNISLDHTALLGDTLAAIAGEKAAIIKPGVSVISGPQPVEAMRVIEQRARELDSPLIKVSDDWTVEIIEQSIKGTDISIEHGDDRQRYFVGLPGEFQVENATVALAALEVAAQRGLPISEQGRERGLANVEWSGRFEVLCEEPVIILDSAHNPYSIRRLSESLHPLPGEPAGWIDRELTFIFGCMADKDIGGMLETLLPIASRMVLVKVDNPRAADLQLLHSLAFEIIEDAKTRGEPWANRITLETAPTIDQAVEASFNSLKNTSILCVTGSLSVAGPARQTLIELIRFARRSHEPL
ncbi:MAG: bifunctional folylpolyglutamate synthase/dihydrofolate synthase [Anaerolineae bacterium]|nr:bifunctional folylpolyglutamate synthase/dihydrofolate synthase [Anaerolineae bacterium]